MNKKFYIAYGSNLSVEQMAYRAPDAELIGKAVLRDWRLLFKTHADIEECPGYDTPVLVWLISKQDEKRLDKYEGWPKYYIKKNLSVTVTPFNSGERFECGAMVYVMAKNFKIAQPMKEYYKLLETGYERFNFDKNILYKALYESVTPCECSRDFEVSLI